MKNKFSFIIKQMLKMIVQIMEQITEILNHQLRENDTFMMSFSNILRENYE